MALDTVCLSISQDQVIRIFFLAEFAINNGFNNTTSFRRDDCFEWFFVMVPSKLLVYRPSLCTVFKNAFNLLRQRFCHK